MTRASTLILVAGWSLAGCLPSEVDCYVRACEASATSSGATASSSSGAGGSSVCGSFGAPRQLVASTPSPRALAVDATDVYWIDASGVYRVAKDIAAPLSAPPLFAPTFREPASDPDTGCVGYDVPPIALALTADLVLWTLADHCAMFQPWGPFLRVAPKAVGMQSPWGEGDALRLWGRGIAVNGKRAYVSGYFQHNQQPRVVDLDPSIPGVMNPTALDTPYDATSLGVSGDYLYFNDSKPGLFRAKRTNLATVETLDPTSVVSRVVVDPVTGVFFVGDTAVKHFDVGLNKVSVLAMETVETPLDLSVDGVCAYWSVQSGHVRAVPHGGGPAVELAEQAATSVAADAQGVYWADAQAGTIWMLPRLK
jgi:hypothetical protein